MGRIAGVTSAETRERLVDAAVRVVELKGYEGATVSLIASEAGLTTGAIYSHFGGKAELLAEALRVHRDRATASLFSTGGLEDAADLLVALGERLRDRDGEESALLVEALLTARRDPELAGVLAEALSEREAFMAEVLAEGQAAGVLTDGVAADTAARFALMVGIGSTVLATLDLPPADRDKWNSFIRRLIAAFTEEQQP